MITTGLVLLAWVIYLKVKIFYGSEKVNKLTFRPFNMAICEIIIRLVGRVAEVFSIERVICI